MRHVVFPGEVTVHSLSEGSFSMKKIMDFFRRFHVYVYMRGFGGDGPTRMPPFGDEFVSRLRKEGCTVVCNSRSLWIVIYPVGTEVFEEKLSFCIGRQTVTLPSSYTITYRFLFYS